MLTFDFQNALENAAGFCGLDRDNLAANEFSDLRGYFNNRLRYGWNYRPWSDLERTEQRYFRGIYASGTTYAAPTATTAVEVFDPETQLYFQSLRSTTGNAPSIAGVENSAYWAECGKSYSADDWETLTAYIVGDQVHNLTDDRYYQCHTAHTSGASFDATKFGVLTPFIRYVSLDQTGATAIGDVLRVTDEDPRVTGQWRDVDYTEANLGVVVLEELACAFICFRTRVTNINGAIWSSTKTYSTGQQVYFASTATTGNFYTCLSATAAAESPDTTPNKWSVVQLPLILQAFCENGMAADWLSNDDRTNAAAKYDALAENFLFAEVIRHESKHPERPQVATR